MDEAPTCEQQDDAGSTFYEPADFVSTLTDAQRARIVETDYGRDAGWVVEYSGEPVALLTEPEWDDMFWDSYLITPLTQDPQVLSQLYTVEFYRRFDEVVYRSREFGVAVKYVLPSANPDDLSTSGRILMRGLYIAIEPPPRQIGPPPSQPARPIHLVSWLRSIFNK